MKIILKSLLLAALALPFTAGAAAKKTQTTPGKPRIVSLSPCLTEIIFALGKGDCLVGRSNVCDYPAAAKKVPAVGNFGIPNFEQVLRVRPTAVVFSTLKDKNLTDKLERMGIKAVELPYDGFTDYFKCLHALGKLLNCTGRADKLAQVTRKQLETLKQQAEKVPFEKRPKVFLVLHDSPVMTIGNKSFLNDIITYAGGRNIAEKKNRAYFNCSLEWVMLEKPDIIFLPNMSKQNARDIAGKPGWNSLRAIKDGNYYYDLNPDLIYRLGPRTVDGIKAMAEYIRKYQKK